jgi:pSer/pThr/pTyr-binding forkhead associated (FHA) protein
MAYLRVMFDDTEIDRRDLCAPVVIGRSPECDIAVRDVLLSRKHCRIEPLPDSDGWQVADLSSKNGTTHNDQPLSEPRRLTCGDVLRLGRVTVLFSAGILTDRGLTPLRHAPLRPADPTETLTGTVCGFEYLEPGHRDWQFKGAFPSPRPKLPAAFDREDVYSLLATIASSSWDSIYAEARQPLPARNDQPDGIDLPLRRLRPRSPIDLSLQADPGTAIGAVESNHSPSPRRPRQHNTAPIALLTSIAVAILVVRLWLLSTAGTSPIQPASANTIMNHPPISSITITPTTIAPPSDFIPSIDPRWIAACQLTAPAIPWLI